MTREQLSTLILRHLSGESSEKESEKLRKLRRKHDAIELEYRRVKSDSTSVSEALRRHRRALTEPIDDGVIERARETVRVSVALERKKKAAPDQRTKTEQSGTSKLIWLAPILAVAAAVTVTVLFVWDQPNKLSPTPKTIELAEAVKLRSTDDKVADAYVVVTGPPVEVSGKSVRFTTDTSAPLKASDTLNLPAGSEAILISGNATDPTKKLVGPTSFKVADVVEDESGNITQLPENLRSSFDQFLTGAKEQMLQIPAGLTMSKLSIPSTPTTPEADVLGVVEELADAMFQSGKFEAATIFPSWIKLPEKYQNDPLLSRFGILSYAERGMKEEFKALEEKVMEIFKKK